MGGLTWFLALVVARLVLDRLVRENNTKTTIIPNVKIEKIAPHKAYIHISYQHGSFCAD
jgi:isoprenylcysteine carboxyl methyltransferase (ICMT) family protein YpbQ